MRRWRMLLLKERSLRTSRRTSFLSILVTNHGHPTSVCLWTNRVEVPQGYCNKKDVRTTQPRAVANRVNFMDEFYSGERKLWTDHFFRYHLLSSPRHRVVLSSISRPNRQQQLQVGRVFPSQVSYCRRVQNNLSSNFFFPIWQHPLFTSFRCRKQPSFENQVLSDMPNTLPAR
ncbi:hypothetical protein EDD17DRAFT_937919 [Pisolithus thermaeus]|nr:hypothetical protein EDD17DRAFT_937919 [Pisolithus thermaeus]